MVLPLLSRLFATDLAIDLGTSNTRIVARGAGLVLDEPSVVAMRDNEVLAAGREAKAMLGREPGAVTVVRPVANGVIAEPDFAQKMLTHFLARIERRWLTHWRPQILMTTPSGITQVERRAVRDVALGAGAREVYLVTEPFAAAIGAGMPIQEARGSLIVTVGGGTTETALLSLAGMVHCESVRSGGSDMDDAIIQWVRKHHSLLIGLRQAEAIKLALGSARPTSADRQFEVKGRGLIDGLPRIVVLSDDEVAEALRDSVVAIVESVRACLERTPPELAADIAEHGIVIAGGGALLHGLDDLLRDEIGLAVTVSSEPVNGAALGAGKMLDGLEMLRRVAASP
ncbi:MAG: rod shape-determining protein [Candidatus Rokuibacteriota bacterium]|nr:MAG: rod shape-determining protein [Candidatus Rokubacteria bacterium]